MDSAVIKSVPLVRVDGVSFNFGYGEVLSDINLDIFQGDFLAIIGPNGSGKTTLIKIILGLLRPPKGRVRLMGKTVEEFDQWFKLGYVPQKATHVDPLFPVSVREVVAMNVARGKKRIFFSKKEEEERIKKVLRIVGMEAHAGKRVGNLSGGQQQRVFIARAIVNQPLILFLDEPTTGVDADMQDKFYDLLSHLNTKETITIVLITHEIGIINRHVNKVACLNKRLEYHGTHMEFCQSDVFRKMLAKGHHVVSHRH